MFKKKVILLLIVSLFLISFVSSELYLGETEPNSDVTYLTTTAELSGNLTLINTNRSEYWNNLYSPLDITFNGIWNKSGTNIFQSQLGDNVGIGTSSPADKLDVAGAIRVTANSVFSSGAGARFYKQSDLGTSIQGVSGTISDLVLITPDGQRLLSNPTGTRDVVFTASGGNVGIGTTNPEWKLDLGSNPSSVTGDYGIGWKHSGASGDSRSWSIAPDSVEYGDFAIRTSDSQADWITDIARFYIDNSGKVGIGTATPTQKLNVVGDGNITGTLYAGNLEVNKWLYNMTTGTYNATYETYAYNMTTGTYNATYAPWAYNQTTGTYNATYETYAYNMTTGTYNATYALSIPYAYNMTIDVDGLVNSTSWNRSGTDVYLANLGDNVGIGTTGPTETLSVIGTINVSNSTGTLGLYQDEEGRVGIGTDSPEGLLQVGSNYVRGETTASINGSDWTPVLSVNLGGNHRSAYVKLFYGGVDWSSHSAIRYEAEFDIIDGAGGYGEPGNIISQKQSSTNDKIRARLVHVAPYTINIELQTYDYDGNGFAGGVNITSSSSSVVYEVQGVFTGIGKSFGANDSVIQTDPGMVFQDGNVGIGAITPKQTLNVVGDGNITGTLYAGNLEVNKWLYNMTVSTGTYNATYATWAYNMTTGTYNATYETYAYNMTIDVDGLVNSTSWNRSGTDVYLANLGDNVGIGTGSPNGKLHVYGSTGAVDLIVGNGISSESRLRLSYDFTNDKSVINSYRGASGYKPLEVDASVLALNANSAGNVGIGTSSPGAKLSFGASTGDKIRFYEGAGGADVYAVKINNNELQFYTSNAADYISMYPNNVLTAVFKNGNVGIGTSSPDYKLQVDGDIAPETNATYDLGTSVLAWDNVFAVTYNDLTPAWLELDGSALESISKITNDGIEINHTSYPMKLRSKYFIVDTEENKIRQVEIGINKTTNETIYREENYTEIVKKEIKVDESLSLTDQEDYVVSKIGATKEEVQTGETIFTRDVGGTLTMIVESIKELFNWNTEQDLEIEELKQENIMMKEDLCSLGITRWCKVVLK